MTNTEAKPEKKIPLVEVFGPTVQGEGAVIGQQTYFLRFGLCDMLCKMCDSMHAVDPVKVKEKAEWLTQFEIYTELLNLAAETPDSTNWVTLSGGNPCIHDLTDLCQNLRINKWRIAVETQGTKCPGWLGLCDTITISPKGPGMGEECDLDKLDKFMQRVNESAMTADKYNMKVVVFDQRDLEFAKMMIERYIEVKGYSFPFYLSQGNPFPPGPRSEKVSDGEIRDTLRAQYLMTLEQISNDRYLSKVRFLPQFHVWLWGNKQGV